MKYKWAIFSLFLKTKSNKFFTYCKWQFFNQKTISGLDENSLPNIFFIKRRKLPPFELNVWRKSIPSIDFDYDSSVPFSNTHRNVHSLHQVLLHKATAFI